MGGTERRRRQETDPDKCRQRPREKQIDRRLLGPRERGELGGRGLLRHRHAKTGETNGETHSRCPSPTQPGAWGMQASRCWVFGQST